MSLLAKKFQTGSFRGAKFSVDTVDADLGRRVVTHEYPQRDTPNTEDLGRKKREFTIEAYVVGANYEAARDALISACETPGRGTLIHPYLGNKTVVCTGCRVREGRTEMGIAYFSLTFVEAGVAAFPTAATDRSTSVFNAATSAIGSASTDFSNKFSIASAPSFALNSATEKVSQFADLMSEQSAKVQAKTEALANFTYGVRNLKANVADLVATPGRLAAQMQGAIADLVALVPGGDPAIKSALTGVLTYGVGFPNIPITTTNRAIEAKNQKALIDLSSRTAVAYQAIDATSRSYGSFEDVIQDRDSIVADIDVILEDTDNDEVFSAFQSLRNEVVKALPQEDADLPQLQTIRLDATAPSLVVAYDLYQSVDNEADLIARNHIRNPAFVSASKDLQVLKAVSDE